jgi:biopolymer transport protein ExbD
MAAPVGGKDVDVNLVPLLDLVLQLIMFFLVTVNFVRVDQFDPSIVLPVAQYAVPLANSTEEPIILNLDPDGKPGGNRKNIDLDTPEKLKAHLLLEKMEKERFARSQGRQGEVKIVVVLRAHKDCRYQKIWEVIDSCQRAGFRRWQLRVMTRSTAPAHGKES